jgi:RimJ/RimL family protein N-acetyltransferase
MIHRKLPSCAPPLHTERLLLEPHTEARFGDVARILTDPAVLWWRETPMGLEEARTVFERVMGEHTSGQGCWLMYERANGDLLGQAMLKPLPSRREWTEVGYHLLPGARGKGYATEGAARLLAYGFDDLHLPEIRAVVLPHNLPSQAVMARLGMPKIGQVMHADMLHDLFCQPRGKWLERQ